MYVLKINIEINTLLNTSCVTINTFMCVLFVKTFLLHTLLHVIIVMQTRFIFII